jgi:SAM-dependent methyltransferase
MTEMERLHRRFSYPWLAHAIRERGVRATTHAALPFFAKLVRLWWWDQTHHVSTRTRVFTRSLGMSGPGAAHARPYEASDTTLLPRLLPRLGIRHSDYVFVDLGAGKGQAVFLAAELPFKRALGVELSFALHEIARQNCRTFRSRRQACTHIQMLYGDAADFAFPAEPLVIYLFDSFDDVVLSRVLANLITSVQEHPRDVLLIYHNPQHRDVIEASGAFERVLTGTDERDFRKVGYEVFRHRG